VLGALRNLAPIRRCAKIFARGAGRAKPFLGVEDKLGQVSGPFASPDYIYSVRAGPGDIKRILVGLCMSFMNETAIVCVKTHVSQENDSSNSVTCVGKNMGFRR
jgi:hypothetical protein